MIRVLIVDDHMVFRNELEPILTTVAGLTVSATAIDGDDALEKLRTMRCDLVLLDPLMSGPGGTDILQRIKNALPDLPVVILSMHPAEISAEYYLEAGAAAYLTKGATPQAIVEAIRAAATGPGF